MSGPSLAPVLIPIVGTLCLIAGLVAVFAAERHSRRDGLQLQAPGQDAGAEPDPAPGSGA